ncbi:membrane-spanning 4-domains subfamily A member 8 [Ciona intestinalis]
MSSVTQPQPNTVMPAPKPKRQNNHKVLGIMQMIIGVLCIGLAIVSFIISKGYYPSSIRVSGAGIWCGIFFLITGILGFLASKSKNSRCLVIATMVLSIMSSVMAFNLIIISITTAVVGGTTAGESNATVIIHSVVAFFALFEFVLSIVHSAVCCAGTCCRKSTLQPQSVSHIVQIPQGQPINMAAGQQAVVYPVQYYVQAPGQMPAYTYMPVSTTAPASATATAQPISNVQIEDGPDSPPPDYEVQKSIPPE